MPVKSLYLIVSRNCENVYSLFSGRFSHYCNENDNLCNVQTVGNMCVATGCPGEGMYSTALLRYSLDGGCCVYGLLAGALTRIPVKEDNHVESGMNNQLSAVSFDGFASPPDRHATFNGFRPSDGEAGKGIAASVHQEEICSSL